MAKFKQACFAHGLSKKFQIFTAVHNSFLGSAAKILLSYLSPKLMAYRSNVFLVIRVLLFDVLTYLGYIVYFFFILIYNLLIRYILIVIAHRMINKIIL